MEYIAYAAYWVADLFTGSAVADGAVTAGVTGTETAGAAGAAEAGITGTSTIGAGSTAAAGTTASTYGTYANIAAAALGGVSAYSSAQNQSMAADYNAQVGRNNSQLAAMQAGANEDAARRRSGIVLGQQRAAFAQSGVDPSSGSGLLVQEQSASNAELDAMNIRYEGLLKGRGLLAQSELDQRQSSIYNTNSYLALGNGALGAYGAYTGGQGSYLRTKATGMSGGRGGYGGGGY